MQRLDSIASQQDLLGVVLSLLCLIHCGLALLGAASLPFLPHSASHLLGGESHSHLWFASGVLVVSALAFGRGFCLHRRLEVVYMALVGVCLVLAALVFEQQTPYLSTVLTITGSVILIGTHFINRKFGASCATCCNH